MTKKLDWIGGEVLPLGNDYDAVVLSIYGPKGGIQFSGEMRVGEARRLAADLIRASDRLDAA